MKRTVLIGVLTFLSIMPLVAQDQPMTSTEGSLVRIAYDDVYATYGIHPQYDVMTGRLMLKNDAMTLSLIKGTDRALVDGKMIRLRHRFTMANGYVMFPHEVISFMKIKRTPESDPPPQVNPPQAVNPRGIKIVIDAGHGGVHNTNKSAMGLREKDVNLDVSIRLQRMLTDMGYHAILTRTSDTHFHSRVQQDLQRRVEISNREVPDLFISIHSNWAVNKAARGFEVFVANRDTASVRSQKIRQTSDEELQKRTGRTSYRTQAQRKRDANRILDIYEKRSRIVAENIRKEFKAGLHTIDRGVKQAGFVVIKWSRAPAVLVELEFLSNTRGAKDLASKAHREKLARLIARAIVNSTSIGN